MAKTRKLLADELVVIHEEVLELLLERILQIVDVPDVGVAVRAQLDAHDAVVSFAFLLISPIETRLPRVRIASLRSAPARPWPSSQHLTRFSFKQE
jgi:hypothetical protein